MPAPVRTRDQWLVALDRMNEKGCGMAIIEKNSIADYLMSISPPPPSPPPVIMTMTMVLGLLLGSWGFGLLVGLLMRVILRSYVQWFT